ncbi:hypothetical protein [Chondromyces apiculatus]|uniref:Uncharacterized protein n=1 Tax=Chondromyces apiculatus DSM 436 TaxID=1192034 RepID=A0A017TFN4_9BACT|nr:hypothetical protein [Chondromyces apiculatus]EYF07630.1 Hypothetical protein CAP_8131 [Chondromyces apiculatus DSM 436]
MRTFGLLAGSLLFLAGTLHAPDAEACVPLPPGVYGTLPDATTATWPVNAPLSFYNIGALPSDASGPLHHEVTVDGTPATLVEVAADPQIMRYHIRARISPEPVPGQEVHISGTFCPPEDQCPEVDLRFTVGEMDEVAPEGTPSVWFDLYDHADEEPDNNCVEARAFTWKAHVEMPPQAAGEGPLLYNIVALRRDEANGGQLVPFRQWLHEVPEATASGGIEETFTLEGGVGLAIPDLAEGFCLQVSVSDEARNWGEEPTTVCAPCHFRQDDAPYSEGATFSDANLYLGGLCADGHVVTEEDEVPPDEVPSDGCQMGASAGAAGAGGSGLWLGALPFAAWLARRRRAARRTT